MIRLPSYRDLVGLPYDPEDGDGPGTNCVGVGRSWLERLGAPLEAGDLPTSESSLWDNLEQLAADPSSSPWRLVGEDAAAASRVGDVILSRGPEGAHVSTVVSLLPVRALTAVGPLYRTEGEGEGRREVLIREGRTFVCPVRRIRGVVGVYRLRRWKNSK